MTAEPIQASAICPLCGETNQCAISLGKPPEQCWCQSSAIDKSALAKIPPAQAGKTCICPKCAQPIGNTDNG